MTRDPELPNGYQDADFEMRELYAAGARSSRADKRMRALRAAGDYPAAARACSHSAGYSTDGAAAEHLNDPRAGQPGMRCETCGSYFVDARNLYDMRDDPESVTAPCELHALKIEAEIAAAEDRIEAGQARWGATGSTRGRA